MNVKLYLQNYNYNLNALKIIFWLTFNESVILIKVFGVINNVYLRRTV